jgi:hypothetical protein
MLYVCSRHTGKAGTSGNTMHDRHRLCYSHAFTFYKSDKCMVHQRLVNRIRRHRTRRLVTKLLDLKDCRSPGRRDSMLGIERDESRPNFQDDSRSD